MEERNSALTVEEVAQKLKIARNTVYELIKRGELLSYRVGRKVRIDLADLNQYIQKSKQDSSGDMEIEESLTSFPLKKSGLFTPASVSNLMGNNAYTPTGFVISGQDSLLDVLTNMLQNHPEGVPLYRSYVGSYSGLISLYFDQCQIAGIHLWDGDSETYNLNYVRRLVPGIPCIILRLAKRVQGFYVKKGNPKKVRSWVCLARKDITIVNREKGCGDRVLLDEMLKKNFIDHHEINGYYNEKTSDLAIANTVADSGADVGLGCGNVALRIKNIDFIPLQTACYDLVIKKENLADPTYKLIYDIICSGEFKKSVNNLEGYQLANPGEIVGET